MKKSAVLIDGVERLFLVRICAGGDGPGKHLLEGVAPATPGFRLDELQQLAEAGQVEELAKVGEVYVRRSA